MCVQHLPGVQWDQPSWARSDDPPPQISTPTTLSAPQTLTYDSSLCPDIYVQVKSTILPPTLLRNGFLRTAVALPSYAREQSNGDRSLPGCIKILLWSFRSGDESRSVCWPIDTVVRLNNENVPIRQRRVTTFNGNSTKKGFSQPVDIFDRLVTGSGELEISTLDTSEPFAIVLQCVCNVAIDDLVARVCDTARSSSIEEARASVRSSFLDNGDEEVTAAATRMSLVCPLSLSPIEIPARGRQCRHLQCFDLRSFFELNKAFSVARYRCGVCSHVLNPTNLIVDAYLMDVIDSIRYEISWSL